MKKIFVSLLLVTSAISLFSFKTLQKFDLKSSITRGKEVYETQCVTCHMDHGQGIESVYPPLAKSDYLMADKKRSIVQVLYGVSGEIKVNGVTYDGAMSGFDLNDQEVSDVLNYVRNSFGNKGPAVTPNEVKGSRK